MEKMLMLYEAFIPSDNSLVKVSKTFEEIEREFDIKIKHSHPSPVEIVTREEPSSNRNFEEGMTIKVEGDYREIRKFREKYDLF